MKENRNEQYKYNNIKNTTTDHLTKVERSAIKKVTKNSHRKDYKSPRVKSHKLKPTKARNTI
jgi:hypothetical protein